MPTLWLKGWNLPQPLPSEGSRPRDWVSLPMADDLINCSGLLYPVFTFHSFAFQGFGHLGSTLVLEQILFLWNPQKVKVPMSFTSFLSPCRHFIISQHHQEEGWVPYNKMFWERARPYSVTFVKVHYYSSILLLVTIGYLFLCLICNKLFMGVYVLEKG